MGPLVAALAEAGLNMAGNYLEKNYKDNEAIKTLGGAMKFGASALSLVSGHAAADLASHAAVKIADGLRSAFDSKEAAQTKQQGLNVKADVTPTPSPGK